jgi:hypothetical protein
MSGEHSLTLDLGPITAHLQRDYQRCERRHASPRTLKPLLIEERSCREVQDCRPRN